jgi:hypothetical protein
MTNCIQTGEWGSEVGEHSSHATLCRAEHGTEGILMTLQLEIEFSLFLISQTVNHQRQQHTAHCVNYVVDAALSINHREFDVCVDLKFLPPSPGSQTPIVLSCYITSLTFKKSTNNTEIDQSHSVTATSLQAFKFEVMLTDLYSFKLLSDLLIL